MLYTNYLKFDDVEAETETETETKQIYREPEGKIFIETVKPRNRAEYMNTILK
jgi:hypothetical protein